IGTPAAPSPPQSPPPSPRGKGCLQRLNPCLIAFKQVEMFRLFHHFQRCIPLGTPCIYPDAAFRFGCVVEVI
ncbi:MAG: hypothetical protein ACI378_07865, partial [Bacteroides sp.]